VLKKPRGGIDNRGMEPTLPCTMRGEDKKQSSMLMLMSPETRVPQDHPLRAIKALADKALAKLSPVFDAMYATGGRPSIPPERLLKSMLLMALYRLGLTGDGSRPLARPRRGGACLLATPRSAGDCRQPTPGGTGTAEFSPRRENGRYRRGRGTQPMQRASPTAACIWGLTA
jgi:hypothetical protein